MRRLTVLLCSLVVGLTTWSSPAQAADAGADSVSWLCRPGMADDPCEIALDTTFQHADGTSEVVTPKRPPQARRKVDCFYVYPTVSNQITPNVTAEAKPEITSIARFQASRYSSICRVYAPLYRQASLPGIVLGPLGTAQTAYGDVLAAWKSYLRHDNHGRGVVLIGHSQGTLLLRKLIREEIDTRPAVRKRLVGALLLGGNTMVAKGSTTGGDFQKIPACTTRGQAGCVVAYSTYDTDPLPISFFGNAGTDLASLAFGIPVASGSQVLCTDPGVLSGNRREFGVTIPSEPYAPGVISGGIALSVLGQVPTAETTWVNPPYRFQGSCQTINGATVFRYDRAPGTTFKPLEFPPLWGTHLFDGNLGLEKLVSIVRQQTATYLAR